jgi:hypothetical protein
MTYPTARASAPQADDYGNRGVYLEWPDFVGWLKGQNHTAVVQRETIPLPPPWKPGQHWAHVGKTREGKTNFVVAKAMACRRYVLALDPKGNDPTLEKTGWPRVHGVPPHKKFPRDIQRDLDEGRPVRLLVGTGTRTRADDEANRELMSQAVEYVRQSGRWTLIVDEHQVATDPRMYRIGPDIARMAVSAASDKTSVEVCMQYISWSEKAPIRQASFISMWLTRNRDLIEKLGEQTGRDWRQLRDIINTLRKYDVLTISDDLRAPVVVTRPPKIG